MNLKQLIKQKVGNKRYPTLKRIKIGRAVMIYAALPLMSAWAFVPGYLLTMPISPTLWAKDKINELKIRRMLR